MTIMLPFHIFSLGLGFVFRKDIWLSFEPLGYTSLQNLNSYTIKNHDHLRKSTKKSWLTLEIEFKVEFVLASHWEMNQRVPENWVYDMINPFGILLLSIYATLGYYFCCKRKSRQNHEDTASQIQLTGSSFWNITQ